MGGGLRRARSSCTHASPQALTHHVRWVTSNYSEPRAGARSQLRTVVRDGWCKGIYVLNTQLRSLYYYIYRVQYVRALHTASQIINYISKECTYVWMNAGDFSSNLTLRWIWSFKTFRTSICEPDKTCWQTTKHMLEHCNCIQLACHFKVVARISLIAMWRRVIHTHPPVATRCEPLDN